MEVEELLGVDPGDEIGLERGADRPEGGPGGASRTVVLYMYKLLQQLRYADATALGVYLFIVVMALVILYRALVDDDPDAPKRRIRRPRLLAAPAPADTKAATERAMQPEPGRD